MTDNQTIALYDAKAADYAKLVNSDKPDSQLRAFMALLPAGAAVLDVGCGPAFASVMLRDAGFAPDPIDASQGMVDMANERFQIGARQMTFDQIDMEGAYDGVWANFSLLHAPRAMLPKHLKAITAALRPDGIFHIGMKLGEGEKRDKIARKYTYVTEDELHGLCADVGLTVIGTETGRDKGFDGTIAPWIVLRARKNA